MGHREVIETGDPRVELGAVRHLIGDVIQARPQRIEGIARSARRVAQAEQEAAVLMKQQDPGIPASPGSTSNSLTRSKPSTRSYQSALTRMSFTVSAMCSARLKVGIAASTKIGSELISPVWEHPGHALRQPQRSTDGGSARCGRWEG